jgi:hypothetical protein
MGVLKYYKNLTLLETYRLSQKIKLFSSGEFIWAIVNNYTTAIFFLSFAFCLTKKQQKVKASDIFRQVKAHFAEKFKGCFV